MRLNKDSYEVKPDNLIYDNSHGLDAANVVVSVPENTAGIIKRGTILDYDATKKAYTIHKSGGVAGAVAAGTCDYAADDTTVTVSVYISGTFRKSACISDVELTMDDLENLRSKGIHLK